MRRSARRKLSLSRERESTGVLAPGLSFQYTTWRASAIVWKELPDPRNVHLVETLKGLASIDSLDNGDGPTNKSVLDSSSSPTRMRISLLLLSMLLLDTSAIKTAIKLFFSAQTP
jgi:hypothetical protein